MVSMKMSGTSRERASQARMMEPRDWPARVKCGQVEGRTQWRGGGEGEGEGGAGGLAGEGKVGPGRGEDPVAGGEVEEGDGRGVEVDVEPGLGEGGVTTTV